MTRILMTVYGITAEQAAARLPAAQFVLTAAVAAVFVWLDSNGALDGVGRWIGRTLREVLDIKKIIIHAPDKSGGKRRQKVEIFFNFVDDVEIPVLAEPMIAESTLGRRKTA